MSETVTGYIDHVIFRNEDNGYTVMVLKDTKKEEELTCVGSFPTITQGATIEATGVYTHHPVYGKQFQISSFVEKMPEDTYAIERYLGSGAIKGIGAALAARIVRRFGQDTLRIVEEEPERLAEVKNPSVPVSVLLQVSQTLAIRLLPTQSPHYECHLQELRQQPVQIQGLEMPETNLKYASEAYLRFHHTSHRQYQSQFPQQ